MDQLFLKHTRKDSKKREKCMDTHFKGYKPATMLEFFFPTSTKDHVIP